MLWCNNLEHKYKLVSFFAYNRLDYCYGNMEVMATPMHSRVNIDFRRYYALSNVNALPLVPKVFPLFSQKTY